MRENLPRKPHKDESGILNLDDSTGTGTHWVGWHKKDKEKFYLLR